MWGNGYFSDPDDRVARGRCGSPDRHRSWALQKWVGPLSVDRGGGVARAPVRWYRLPSMIPEWLIVLNADGTVFAVDGGVPSDWVGTRLDGRSDVPPEVRDVAAGARRQFDESAGSAGVTSTTAAPIAQRIRVIVLSAMPVRRVATDLRALLESTINVMELQARAIDAALTLEMGPDVPRTLFLDPEKTAWTITALIGNALRFVRRGTRLMPGGTVEVTRPLRTCRLSRRPRSSG